MGTPGDEFGRLLAGVGPFVSGLAGQLMEAHGIPHLVHGPDFDIAELGTAAHQSLRGADVYVPASALAEARRILDEAWGEGATAPPRLDEDPGQD